MSRQTIGSVRREVMRRISDVSPSAALDARMLVAHLVGCVPGQLALRDDEEASEFLVSDATALAVRRAAGEPVARILGEKEFHGLVFTLTPDTLIPRPDTETLVDAALAIAKHRSKRGEPFTILDLGTGSGAILISLLSEMPHATGLGIDLAAGAVTAARENAERLGIGDRATFLLGNWAQGIHQRFDVVVANPPYIETGSIAGLPVEVREHDPRLALDGGADGLDAIHDIVTELDRLLEARGTAFVEIGAGQAAIVTELVEAHGFRAEFRRDLAGIERVVVLRRQGEK